LLTVPWIAQVSAATVMPGGADRALDRAGVGGDGDAGRELAVAVGAAELAHDRRAVAADHDAVVDEVLEGDAGADAAVRVDLEELVAVDVEARPDGEDAAVRVERGAVVVDRGDGDVVVAGRERGARDDAGRCVDGELGREARRRPGVGRGADARRDGRGEHVVLADDAVLDRAGVVGADDAAGRDLEGAAGDARDLGGLRRVLDDDGGVVGALGGRRAGDLTGGRVDHQARGEVLGGPLEGRRRVGGVVLGRPVVGDVEVRTRDRLAIDRDGRREGVRSELVAVATSAHEEETKGKEAVARSHRPTPGAGARPAVRRGRVS